jgi:hypothetical protein
MRRPLYGPALLLIVAIVGGAAGPLAAQESPRDVAEAFFKAVAEERWRDAARRLDLAAFDRYRRERVATARLQPTTPAIPTPEELMRHDPDMPRAVAEYQVRKMATTPDYVLNWVQYEFAQVANVDSLAAIPVEDAAARWLQAGDIRWQAQRVADWERRRGCPLPPEAHQMPPPSFQISGFVIADSATAYVLYTDAVFRRAQPDVDADVFDEGPQVLILRRRAGRWLIRPRHKLLSGALGFVFSPDCPARPPGG